MIPLYAGSKNNGIPPLCPAEMRCRAPVGMTGTHLYQGRVFGKRLESMMVFTRQETDRMTVD